MEPTGGSADDSRCAAAFWRAYGGGERCLAMREAAWAAFTLAPEAGVAGTNSGSPYEPCSRLTITVERLPSASIFASRSSGMRIATSVVGIVIHLCRLLYTSTYCYTPLCTFATSFGTLRHAIRSKWYIYPHICVRSLSTLSSLCNPMTSAPTTFCRRKAAYGSLPKSPSAPPRASYEAIFTPFSP